MAVSEKGKRSGVSLKLDGGLNPVTGKMKTVSCPLGKVVRNASAEKVADVVGALVPVLEYPMVEIQRTEVTVLEIV
ncbi:MAG: hypothetical protein LBR61_08910 [Synergistaceae bacterium]|jgi:hypothetical protein|nr:hypothetical protein [Synergistaceae bacterium]